MENLEETTNSAYKCDIVLKSFKFEKYIKEYEELLKENPFTEPPVPNVANEIEHEYVSEWIPV